MIQIPNMILIGATWRNSGKTELALRLISYFLKKKQALTALKVTSVDPEEKGCPRGGKGCGVCTSFKGAYLLTEEHSDRLDKDTSRLKKAGARRVFWLRVKKNKLKEGILEFLKNVPPDELIICESNSLRLAAQPGLFLLTNPAGNKKVKSSCKAVAEYADRILEFENFDFNFDLAGISYEEGRVKLAE